MLPIPVTIWIKCSQIETPNLEWFHASSIDPTISLKILRILFKALSHACHNLVPLLPCCHASSNALAISPINLTRLVARSSRLAKIRLPRSPVFQASRNDSAIWWIATRILFSESKIVWRNRVPRPPSSHASANALAMSPMIFSISASNCRIFSTVFWPVPLSHTCMNEWPTSPNNRLISDHEYLAASTTAWPFSSQAFFIGSNSSPRTFLTLLAASIAFCEASRGTFQSIPGSPSSPAPPSSIPGSSKIGVSCFCCGVNFSSGWASKLPLLLLFLLLSKTFNSSKPISDAWRSSLAFLVSSKAFLACSLAALIFSFSAATAAAPWRLASAICWLARWTAFACSCCCFLTASLALLAALEVSFIARTWL